MRDSLKPSEVMIIERHRAGPTQMTSIQCASAKASHAHHCQCSALIAMTTAALLSRTPSNSGSVSVLCGIRHAVWVDLSVWFSAHEGRSFDSDVSYVHSRLGCAYVLADGIFYLPKWFDLVSVIPQVYHGSIPKYPQIPFGLPSFLQE